ncbi:MAG: BatD family protein [Bacteroidales bacterium]|jgi:hypothetical protein|nr:BatD family protein [Bacteroidales bacterium]
MKNIDKKYGLLGWLIFLSLCIYGQDVHVTVNCPRIVQAGEPFQLDVVINAKASQPEFPEMEAFNILYTMQLKQGSQTHLSGGKMVRSVSFTYSYAVEAVQEGTQEFPPVEVTVGKQKYSSSAVQIQVIAKGASSSSAQPPSGEKPSLPDNSQIPTDHSEVFVSIIPSRTKLYQGEYITATLKLFSKVNISNLNSLKAPGFEGFYKQELEVPPLRNLVKETVNGETYGTGVLQQFVLFPQKSGTLTISPCSLEAGVVQRVQTNNRSIWDDIFGSATQTVAREIKSRPVNITVMPLPEGKPASFGNGVGQMKMNVAADKTTLKANDPVTLKIVISGTGNLKFVDAPRINFPPDFEVWEPKVNVNLNAATTTGSKTFEYVLVPRHDGNYKLPAAEFSYFDPQAGQYKTLRSEEIVITVEKGNEQFGADATGRVTREGVKLLGNDIRYIRQNSGKWRKAGEYFFGTAPFILWYVIPLLAFSIFVYARRKYIRKYADAAFVKNKRANRYASRRLKQARLFLNGGKQARMYEELSKALWGYLSDKLNIPVADLSKETGKQMLRQRQVNETLINEFIDVIDDCEFARYAPPEENADMKTLYDRAAEAINKMQKTI